jgi:hydroxypyruvate isomerase
MPPELLPDLCKNGLGSALGTNGMPDPAFKRGFNNLQYHDEVIRATRQAIERCADFGIPNVIAFSGYKWLNADDPESGELPLGQGATNCVKALKELAPFAERNRVQICLEHLNTRDSTHPMKGHPGYQCDDIDYVADIVAQVDSPAVKLLFDVYHVQIMNGDVIRRIRQYADLIGHVHTAGCPGRGELDDAQEIHYLGVARALDAVGYDGFIGHEFIPVREPSAGMAEAIKLFEI